MFFETTTYSQSVGEELLASALDQFGSAGLERDHMALTLLLYSGRLSDADNPVTSPQGYAASGERPFYPCSVVKMFYLVAAQAAIEEGKVENHSELERAMHDMIRWSSNTATNYIIDLVTDTTGDTLLQGDEFVNWVDKRNAINRFFREFKRPEYEGINVCQKLMDDERYGREKLFATLNGNNHNRLTTNASAYLLHEIMAGRAVSKSASKGMSEMLERPLDVDFKQRPGAQVCGYLGDGLPPGAKLWSKAGWTGWTGDPAASYRRHDAAYVELSDDLAFTLVVFTEGKRMSESTEVLPGIASLACRIITHHRQK
ncbi:serine hydrolase [Microvirga rosea]|uniref:serine hydrolase n=1 Tax=Microvirga rosea TaxID=2715425 RepID=UPI001D0A9FCE|nr:serine hydrolase [Microvirga rosea]MCB8822489.1 class A beta-lactamase-related serine hydrolase [Microvirga rosea]